MTSKKITELNAVTSLVDTDLFPVVQDVPTVPVTKKTTFLKIKEALLAYFNYYYTQIDGWIPAVVPWTYASATTFTVSGDVTTFFPKGTKIKLIQTTAKYFYVTSAVYASPNTTVTVTGGSDYTLSNAAITSAWYSYAETPQGFPDWFNWTPSFTGFSTNPVGTHRFKISGKVIFLQIYHYTPGTSNSASFIMTAPVKAVNLPNTYWSTPIRVMDNNTIQTSPGFIYIGADSENLVTGKTMATGGGFTASGNKSITSLNFFYEI
ncbi:hypothetical protein ATHL_01999 [Anaerolinea thermolimosa]|uniref:hypothetical protein n=1 Tax=Anaerolinea thermolimosa TaxID=229919 RepID=UPI0007810841|nr:hypothetical protein [Anaerolinea thermolimosa]GAP07131.1 hypothetical protein ATHL_01999 [Anaerolinea thermolimosa]